MVYVTSRSPFRRPCLDCGALTRPGRSRCPEHETVKERKRKLARGPTPVAKALRTELNQQVEWPCNECALVYPPTYLIVDHIVPLKDRGADTLDNLQILCDDCSRIKTTAEAKARASSPS